MKHEVKYILMQQIRTMEKFHKPHYMLETLLRKSCTRERLESEAATRGVLQKKVFLEISQNL